MYPLAGLNKVKVAIVIFLFVFAGMSQSFSGTYKQTCLGDNYVLTYVTPTIQTIAFYSKQYGGKHSLLRGRIEFLAVDDRFVAGYLSTRFFKEDELVDLAGENDKEGFFIVSKHDGSVMSGIDGGSFFKVMEEQYHAKLINFFKPDQAIEFGNCQAY